MAKELIDVLDENGMHTGEVLARDEIHKRGLWHRAIVVAIINENNEILLQQRSEKKEKNPVFQEAEQKNTPFFFSFFV